MTYKQSNGVVVIHKEPDTECIRCKKIRECRDVLNNGTQMCFECATPKEKEEYCQRLFGG